MAEKRKRRHLSDQEMEDRLYHLFERVLQKSGGDVQTFSTAGIMTSNKGLVLNLKSGQSFQLTIVDSTRR